MASEEHITGDKPIISKGEPNGVPFPKLTSNTEVKEEGTETPPLVASKTEKKDVLVLDPLAKQEGSFVQLFAAGTTAKGAAAAASSLPTFDPAALWSTVETWRLEKKLIDDTADVREWLFWTDNMTRKVAQLVIQSVVGSRIGIVSKNKDIEKSLNSWNSCINVRGQSIEDVISIIVIDNFIFGNVLFYKQVENNKLNLYHLDWKEITKVEHEFKGWIKFIQNTMIYEMPNNKNTFDKTYNPTLSQPATSYTANIPYENVLYLSMWRRALMSSVRQAVYIKQWMMLYMARFFGKFSSPTPIIKVPIDYLQGTTKSKYQAGLTSIAERAAQWKNYDAWAVPADWEVELLEAKNAMALNFPAALQMLDEQIALGLLSTINLIKTTSGDYKPEMIQRSWVRFIESIRGRIARALKDQLYIDVLKAEGLLPEDAEVNDLGENDFEIKFSRIDDAPIDKLVGALIEPLKEGVYDAPIAARLLKDNLPDIFESLNPDEIEEKMEEIEEAILKGEEEKIPEEEPEEEPIPPEEEEVA